mmetsp:Transcript_64862/g.193905  ORF Transcript_64862/g.193905 Transcript_64862/m.193905 type:complete len:202 (+) Transcript_64862:3-608(+)
MKCKSGSCTSERLALSKVEGSEYMCGLAAQKRNLRLRVLVDGAVRSVDASVHLHPPSPEVRHHLRRLLLNISARREGKRGVVGILRVIDSKVVAARRRRPARQREVVSRAEGAQVVRVLRAPRLHDGRDEEGETPRAKKISLLYTDDGEEGLDDAVHFELHMHSLVQGDEQVDQLARNAILPHHLPQQLPRHPIESLDKVQ